MTDILPLRAARDSLAAALPPQQAILDELQTELDNAAGDGLPPPALAALRAQVLRQARLVQHMEAELAAAQSAYQAAALADPMHQADPGLPLVLLPVRIETAYLPGAREREHSVAANSIWRGRETSTASCRARTPTPQCLASWAGCRFPSRSDIVENVWPAPSARGFVEIGG